MAKLVITLMFFFSVVSTATGYAAAANEPENLVYSLANVNPIAGESVDLIAPLNGRTGQVMPFKPGLSRNGANVKEDGQWTSDVTILVEDSVNHTALGGATVTLNGVAHQTNKDGKVTFSALTVGTYSYSVTANGYDGSTGNSVAITVGTKTATPTVYLTKQTGSATILVEDSASHAAINGATVTLNGVAHQTDRDGKATFSDLKAGTYSYSVIANGYNGSNDNRITIVAGTKTVTSTVYLAKM